MNYKQTHTFITPEEREDAARDAAEAAVNNWLADNVDLFIRLRNQARDAARKAYEDEYDGGEQCTESCWELEEVADAAITYARRRVEKIQETLAAEKASGRDRFRKDKQ